jgi:DNA-binding transcriptional MerR regulator
MKNLHKIGVAARILQCDAQTLRKLDWAGYFAPRRDRLGRRLYSNEDLALIREILALRRPGRPRKHPRRALVSVQHDGQIIRLTPAELRRGLRRGSPMALGGPA